MPAAHQVVLDTDLGSDVDDALALAVLLGSPEVDLVGAITVYGDVALRARLTRAFAALAGRDLPVATGVAEPLSGREVWVSGEEGQHFPMVDDAPHVLPPAQQGVGFLPEHAREAAGTLEIVAVGPLTNLAVALRDPGFAGSVRQVWLMGGRFDGRPADGRRSADEPAEHNFAADAPAAAQVVTSGLPITVTGLEVTRRLRLHEPEVATIGRCGALGRQLERELRAWMAYWDEPFDVPHDAITVIAMLRPDLFTHRRARVSVIAEGPEAGRVIEVPLPSPAPAPLPGPAPRTLSAGEITVVTDLDVPAVTREIITRITAAGNP